jgi:Tfp pilus assembly protein PilN
MIRINLLPVREAARKRDVKNQLLLTILAWVGVVMVLVTWYQAEAAGVGQVQGKLRKLTAETTNLERKAGTKAKLEEEEKLLKEKAEIIDLIDKLRAEPARVLYEVASLVPNRVWLTEVSFYPVTDPMSIRTPLVAGGDNVMQDQLPLLADPTFAISMMGYAMGPKDLTDFAKATKASPLFNHVELGKVAEVIFSEADIPVQQFRLYAKINKWVDFPEHRPPNNASTASAESK